MRRWTVLVGDVDRAVVSVVMTEAKGDPAELGVGG